MIVMKAQMTQIKMFGLSLVVAMFGTMAALTPVRATEVENNTNTETTSTSSESPKTKETTTSTTTAKKCGNVSTSIISCPEGDENQIIFLLKRVVNIFYGIIAVLAVLMIIVAGAIYATAGDQDDKVKLAKSMIKNTVIGILLYVFMTVILNFLIPGGIF